MRIVFTPERAERLTRTFEAHSAYTVKRLIEDRPVISARDLDGYILATRVYARIYRGGFLRCNITYESIDVGSVIL